MKSRSVVVALVALSLLVLVEQAYAQAGSDSEWQRPIPESDDTEHTQPQDPGFIVRYEHPSDDWYEEMMWYYYNGDLLEYVAYDLNESFVLPHDVYILLSECGASKVYYDPDERSIVMCYEYIGHIADIAYDYYGSDEQIWEFVDAAVIMTLYRQVGYALIDIYTPHIAELQEDMPDQFSLLMDNGPGMWQHFDRDATFRFYGSGDRISSTSHDLGDFVVDYYIPDDDWHEKIMWYYHDRQFVESVADHLNELFILPHYVSISMIQCGEENAFYNHRDKEIILCYEYVEYFLEISSRYYDTNEHAWEFVDAAIISTLYHEVGHALIDIYDLPITGPEEDSADQFSALLAITLGGEDNPYNHAAMIKYYERGNDEYHDGHMPFHDTHSLGLQRYYNMMCWTYGSDTEKYDYLVSDGGLPEDRAWGCEYEYYKMNDSWSRLLQPYLK